ncbi:expressed unknown protein [Seminavis robusta]|uniref:SAP domain-containing protein n=1 Tax=Seminavis robusta TaxID=568900 RepID=A0A9N8DDJ3_9STRA|nr:expressed unknown protein [Seminavis robusta]|eukprot:Sro93_g048250.1 n/a (359) ;mRNA; r:5371-6447
MSGYGITEDYSWKEDALEIELTVQVPPGTQTKDVHFKARANSIDLRVDTTTLDNNNNNNNNNTKQQQQLILLDGSRKLRGRLSLDGTFWTFSDRRRSITMTLEKYLAAANEYDVVDYDWKGIYPEEEILESKYDEPEMLNVKEYAASLGVDVDNINRSMVDETMFSSGLNLTQKTLEQLTDKGYLEQVTQQADGREYQTNPETGEKQDFAMDATTNKKPKDPTKIQIPFLDTQAPWQQQQTPPTVPVAIDETTKAPVVVDPETLSETVVQQSQQQTQEKKKAPKQDPLSVADPIEQLTVKRLKEILKQQGLKVSGNKKELQERLRDQVNSILTTTTKKSSSTSKANNKDEEGEGLVSP